MSAGRIAWIAAVVLLGLLGLTASGLPRIEFDDDINRVFLSQSPLSQAQRRLEAEGDPPSRTVMLMVEGGEPFDAGTLAALRDMALDLELLPGVQGVLSPFLLRTFGPDGPGAPIIADGIDESEIDRRLAAFRDAGSGLPLLINPDRTALALLVSIDAEGAAETTQAVREHIDAALPPGLTGNVTGEEVIAGEIASGLRRDLLILNGAGSAILVVAALVLFASPRLALLACVPGILGALSVLGFSGLIGFPITVISNVIPILILVLGVSNGIHLALAWQAADGDRRQRLVRVMAEVAPACALSSLTTALAFATIMLTGNRQLWEFAILGAAGMVLSFAVTLAGFVLLTLAMPLGSPRPPRLAPYVARRLYALGRRAPRAVVGVALVLTVIGAIGFTATRAWFPLYLNLPAGSSSGAAADRMADDFGGAFLAFVELDSGGPGGLSGAEGWARYRSVAEAVEAAGWPSLSLLSLARWTGDPDRAPAAAVLDELPQTLTRQLLPPTADVARIMVMMPEPMRSDEAAERYDRFEAAAEKAGADRVLGLPAVMRHESIALIRTLSLSLASATILATMVVAVSLRSWRSLPALFLPNILPILLCAAALFPLAGGKMTPTAVLALTIAFGIAVDDTIHFASRFALERRRSKNLEAALDTAAERAGPAMVLTTMLLLAGLSVTVASVFEPIREFGGLMMLALAVALLLDLLLLPALLLWTETRR